MTFAEALVLVAGRLLLEQRVTYRRMRSEFGIDREMLEDVPDRHDREGRHLELLAHFGQRGLLAPAPLLLIDRHDDACVPDVGGRAQGLEKPHSACDRAPEPSVVRSN